MLNLDWADMEDFVDEEEDDVDLFNPGNNISVPNLKNAAKSTPASVHHQN